MTSTSDPTPHPSPRPTPRPTRPALSAIAVAAALGLAGCGPTVPDDVIDRETFIDTYVDLRTAALDTDSQRIAGADRERILSSHGVDADELARFAEVYATELEFMRDVWNDIELRLDVGPEEN